MGKSNGSLNFKIYLIISLLNAHWCTQVGMKNIPTMVICQCPLIVRRPEIFFADSINVVEFTSPVEALGSLMNSFTISFYHICLGTAT